MGEISLAGVLVITPPATSGFPGAEVKLPLISTVIDYQLSVSGLVSISSPDDYVEISLPMSEGQLLYCKVDLPITVRLTTTDGAVALPVGGIMLLEFPPAKPLTKFEVKGMARVEYLVTGQA